MFWRFKFFEYHNVIFLWIVWTTSFYVVIKRNHEVINWSKHMFTHYARQVISGWNWKRENDVVLNTLNHRMNVSIRTICFCVWFKRINSSCEVVRINYKVTQKENIYFLYLLFIFFFFRVKCIVLFSIVITVAHYFIFHYSMYLNSANTQICKNGISIPAVYKIWSMHINILNVIPYKPISFKS